MKILKSNRFIMALLFATAMTLTYCTKNDQVLNVNPVTETPADENTTQMVSVKVSTPPAIDGQIDGVWSNASKLTVHPVVPNPGNGLFIGYIGKTYNVSLRSLYDDQYIYI